MKETDMIKRLQERDPNVMDDFLLHYRPLILYILSPILPNPADREECLSEIAFKVWEHGATYTSNKGSFTGWLTAITRNTALNYARKKTFPSEEIPENFPANDLSPEEQILRAERQAKLVTALDTLSKKEQQLFYRKYYYLQSTAQIAAELDLSERSVEGKLYRIRKKLQKQLGGDRYV